MAKNNDFNPLKLLLVAVPAIALFKFPAIKEQLAKDSIISKRASEDALFSEKLKTEQLRTSDLAEFADQRYSDNCWPILSLSVNDTYTAITPYSPVVKGEYAEDYKQNGGLTEAWSEFPTTFFHPAGTVVCDAYGNTGILAIVPEVHQYIPVVTLMARTGNDELIQQRMASVDAYQPNLVH